MLLKLFNHKNKIVFVTGSSGQIGNAIVKLYLNLGCKVYGLDINRSSLKHKNFFFNRIDITNDKEVKKIIENIFKKHKKIDVLINNAGTSVYTKIDKRNNSELQKVYELNLRSVINIIKFFFISHKKYRSRSSSIINVASIYGFLSPDFRIYSKGERFSAEIYGATKASVIQITKYFSVLLAPYNIRVNSLSPGGIKNKNVQSKKFMKKYSSRVPLNRMGNTNDLLTTLIYLSSDWSQYTTGQNIAVDGGLSSK
jgi:NAD(P)-dependent dehydrogenase (short-subunit alcohol dehydrogenase family)